jgi:hypothetical protein
VLDIKPPHGAVALLRAVEGRQSRDDLILGVVILMPLTVCLVVVAVTWTLEDLAAWSDERAKKGRH